MGMKEKTRALLKILDKDKFAIGVIQFMGTDDLRLVASRARFIEALKQTEFELELVYPS